MAAASPTRRGAGNDPPDARVSSLATAFAQRVHAWAVANYQARLNMFCVVLTADATTDEDRQQLRIEGQRFAARFDMNDEGAWLTMETGKDGHHHVHGLLITELELDEVIRLWQALVTNLPTHRRAQWGRHTPCSTKSWRAAKGLCDQIDGWACYSMKAENDGRVGADKVIAATGQLGDPWSEAVLAEYAPSDERVRRCGNCCAPLRAMRRDARFCRGACRRDVSEKRASQRTDAVPAVVEALLDRGSLTKEMLEQDLDHPRALVRGACKLLARQGAIRRTRLGWVLADEIVAAVQASELWSWRSGDQHFEGNDAAQNCKVFP